MLLFLVLCPSVSLPAAKRSGQQCSKSSGSAIRYRATHTPFTTRPKNQNTTTNKWFEDSFKYGCISFEILSRKRVHQSISPCEFGHVVRLPLGRLDEAHELECGDGLGESGLVDGVDLFRVRAVFFVVLIRADYRNPGLEKRERMCYKLQLDTNLIQLLCYKLNQPLFLIFS